MLSRFRRTTYTGLELIITVVVSSFVLMTPNGPLDPTGSTSAHAAAAVLPPRADKSQEAQKTDESEKPARRRPARSPAKNVHLRAPSGLEFKIEVSLQDQTEFEFIDLPLRDCMTYLSQQHNIQILLDLSAMTAEGIPADEPITLSLRKVSLASALQHLLEPQGLDYVIAHDVLRITTKAVAAGTLELRVYPIADLVAAGFEEGGLAETIRHTIAADSWRLQQPVPFAPLPMQLPWPPLQPSPVPSSPQPALPLDRPEPAEPDQAAPAAVIPTPVPFGARPHAYSPLSRAALSELPGCLVISQSQRVHRRIVDFFEQLRRLPKVKP